MNFMSTLYWWARACIKYEILSLVHIVDRWRNDVFKLFIYFSLHTEFFRWSNVNKLISSTMTSLFLRVYVRVWQRFDFWELVEPFIIDAILIFRTWIMKVFGRWISFLVYMLMIRDAHCMTEAVLFFATVIF